MASFLIWGVDDPYQTSYWGIWSVGASVFSLIMVFTLVDIRVTLSV